MSIRLVRVRIPPDGYPMAAFESGTYGRLGGFTREHGSPLFDPKECNEALVTEIRNKFERKARRLRKEP
jgi:hypothetical protein